MKLSQVFEDLGEFVALYRGRISAEGMAFYSDTPYQEGTVLDVELSLKDDLVLVRGQAGGEGSQRQPC